MKITLELHGLPSQTSEAEFIRREGSVAIVRAYGALDDDTVEKYSLIDGKRLGANWDFWRICAKDRQKIIRGAWGKKPPDVAQVLDRLGL